MFFGIISELIEDEEGEVSQEAFISFYRHYKKVFNCDFK